MRTQEEILKRLEVVDDIFGTQFSDLIEYLEFKHAKQFLKKDFVSQVESGEMEWVFRTDPTEEILGYLDFAYEKAEDERGLSAYRSLMHFKAWIWLDDEHFYNIIEKMIDRKSSYGVEVYGIDILDCISKHYGFVRK